MTFITHKYQLAVMMNKVEDILMDILEEKCTKEEDVPAYKTAQGLTFQIITKTAFAMDVDCQRNENVRKGNERFCKKFYKMAQVQNFNNV